LGNGSTAFVNNDLPDGQFDGVNEPQQVLMPFFVDMGVTNNGRDGVWYYANASFAAVEWRTSDRFNGSDEYDFSLEYNAASPGVFTYRYYLIGIYASIATVGMQGGPTGMYARCDVDCVADYLLGPYIQWDDTDTPISDGMVLVCNTLGNPPACLLG
jgi:hypothetical protein